jgi:hypothetical protein
MCVGYGLLVSSIRLTLTGRRRAAFKSAPDKFVTHPGTSFAMLTGMNEGHPSPPPLRKLPAAGQIRSDELLAAFMQQLFTPRLVA